MSAPVYTPADDQERAMWTFMKGRRKFTIAELNKACTVTDWKRSNFFAKLRRKGLLYRCGREDGRDVFTVMDAETTQKFSAGKRQSPEGAIWAAMRTLKAFNVNDLMMIVGPDEVGVQMDALKKYVSVLLTAKYLKVLDRAKPGIRPARYRLVKDTGPLPPSRKTKVVLIDGNEERVVHVTGAQL